MYDSMHVDGVGADRLHGRVLGLVTSEDVLLAGFIPCPLVVDPLLLDVDILNQVGFVRNVLMHS